jgi:Nucleotidyl transferase AbiEii toxin, Type IV TA system
LWTGQQYRPTRDADFLGRGQNSPERFFRIFRELCSVEPEPDGLRFDPDTVTAERITEDADYEGVRVSFTAYLERAKIPIQIDIGFGDAVTPPPIENNYPTLPGSTAPRLFTYPRETVVAEKLEAMVELGIANSRMKDFYDMEVLSRTARESPPPDPADLPDNSVPESNIAVPPPPTPIPCQNPVPRVTLQPNSSAQQHHTGSATHQNLPGRPELL